MGLLRIIIGALIGSLISVGAAIGLYFGGIQVSWWLALILMFVATTIGGFIAGWIAQDKFPGMIAGALAGIIVFGGVVVFFWLFIKAKMNAWSSSFTDLNTSIITPFLDYLNIDPVGALGTFFTNKITDAYTSSGSDVTTLIQTWVPKLALVFGAIIGGGAFLINLIAGRIGGRFNKIDEIVGD